jgi:DNA polymerase-3 subunit gamma/tau
MRTATDQRLVLEVGMTRAAMPEASLDADALLARVERLERRMSIGSGDPGVAAEPPTPPSLSTSPEPAAAQRPAPAEAAPATEAPPPGEDGPTGEDGRSDRSTKAKAKASRGKAAPSAKPAAATAAGAEVEDDWAAPPPPAAGPIDFDLVTRSWGMVMQRVQTASRVTATFLEHGRLAGLENRQVVVEFSPEDRFHAEALGKNGRDQHVNVALEAVLGGGLGLRVVVGNSVPPMPPSPDAPAAVEDGEAGAEAVAAVDPAIPPVVEPTVVDEFEIDPDHDKGEPLDSDADTRAVADWAARELGGQVIDEHPNKAAGGRRTGSAKTRERSERGKR